MLPKRRNKLSNDLCNNEKAINNYLFKKYSKFEFSFSRICINNLINKEKSRVVARFKDFLILDDNTEFIHKYYDRYKLFKKLKYILNFYTSYSRIYPNYLIIPENKFLYKNLRKKQKIIDEENALKFHKINNSKLTKLEKIIFTKKDKTFFNENIIESINKHNISSNLNTTRKSSSNNKSNEKNNNLSLNTKSSGFIENIFYEENSNSKASLTEIINLINGRKNNKNDFSDKFNEKQLGKIKSNKNHRFKFLKLNINFINKNIRTYKPKLYIYNLKKNENNKSLSIKKEYFNTKKNSKNIIFHKPAFSSIEDISRTIKNKNNKRQQLDILSKMNTNKINNIKNLDKLLGIKTVTSFGNIYSKMNKFNDGKNTINNPKKNIRYKIRRKNNSHNFNNLIISSTISTNSTINFGTTISKINNSNNYLRQNKNYNKSKRYYLRKNNHQIMKSIEAIISNGKNKKKILTHEKDSKKSLKLEIDSFQSTQVSVNKKTIKRKKHSLSYVEKIIAKIIKNFKNISSNKNNNTLSSFSKNCNKVINPEHHGFNNKISSYGCKPFPEYYQKNLYSSKLALKKERTSILSKNNKIFNFFTSKEFYNLRINKYYKNAQNTNTIKINHINKIKKNTNTSTNKNKEKFKQYSKDVNVVDSNSFSLKIFNNENNSIIGIKKNNDSKILNYKNNKINDDKLKIKNNKYLFIKTTKYIGHIKPDSNSKFNTKTKNNAINILKNIEKTNKIKNRKVNMANHKRSNITLLNCINKNNMNIQLKFKTPSNILIKSLEIKNNNYKN